MCTQRYNLRLHYRIRENQHDYAVMSEYMLAATLALNDMIRMGVAQDWATHMIGHELTALHGLTHGATLAIVINGTSVSYTHLDVYKRQAYDAFAYRAGEGQEIVGIFIV